MGEYLIVDGYNVIFAWPELEDYKNTNLESARSRLIDTLANHAALTGIQIIIVFDAHSVKYDRQRVENEHGLKVIYTEEGETADALIEKLIGNFTRHDTVYVVTSDWAEQRIIFGRGAYRITPKELLQWVERIKIEGKDTIKGELKDHSSYLENYLEENIRVTLEKWRRQKS